MIEQFTYLLFIKRLDEIHTRREARANTLGQPLSDPIFGPDQQNLLWSRFKNGDARTMYDTIVNGVFPFMKGMRDDQTALAVHMKDARFTRPPEKAELLAKVFDSKLLGYYYLTNTPISQYPKLFLSIPKRTRVKQGV